MLKNKKQKTNMGISEPHFGAHNMPSKDCKKFLVKFMVKFYEQNSAMALKNKFVRYSEESINKFKTDMTASMMQALCVSQWIAETEKRGFRKFLDQRVHDSLWNTKKILAKYGKDH